MPGPFPGMDPFLEAPEFWQPFHDRLIFHLGTVLQEVLPENYVAEFEQRVELVMANREILPDITVSRDLRPSEPPGARMLPPDEAVQVVVPVEEARERFIEVIRVPDGQVVTVIELSSPTNKIDPRGRRAYLKKQQSVLESDVSLIEIDLLRSGHHWAAVPESLAQRYQPYDYLVCVSRPADRMLFECYFRTAREALPAIGVPLASGDPDVTLAVQEAFHRAFDQGRYGRRIDYAQPLSPPLRAEDTRWAEALLRERGLLP